MPESDLSLSVDDLRAEIGHFLGYGRGPTFDEPEWTTLQANNIRAILKSGLSQVFTPPPLSEGQAAHNWSFLRPFATLTLESGKSTCDLPATFGGFEGPIIVTNPQSARKNFLLRLTHEGMVQQMHAQQPDTVGAPRVACEKVLAGTSRNSSSRYQLYVWPVSDQAYTLRAEYKHLQSSLSGDHPYPPGGAEHAELFKASCLAAAELQLDDQPGPRWQFFMQRLAASVAADRKRKASDLIGYNGDRSDSSGTPRTPGYVNRYFDNPAVTYNGSEM
jgi:hypothetical protein